MIARSTAFTFKGKPFDVRSIGQDLHVRYVLEGTVRRSESRLRVGVRLTDAETGAPSLDRAFDRTCRVCFDLQDEITAVSRALHYVADGCSEGRGAKDRAFQRSRCSIDLMMRGWAALWQPVTKKEPL